MTCIIGLLDKDICYIGGDTFGSNGHYGHATNHSKVFKTNGFVIGGTTSFRMLDLLEYSFSPTRNPYPDEDMDKYMRTVFIDSVRNSLKTGGFALNKNGEESGGTFIVGYKDKMWKVQDDFSVLNYSPYCAVGSGYEVALGSMYTTEDTKMKPEERIVKALEAASKFIVSVSGPFTVLNTGATPNES